MGTKKGKRKEIGAGSRNTNARPSAPNSPPPPPMSDFRVLFSPWISVSLGRSDHKHATCKSAHPECLSQNHLRLVSVPSVNILSLQASNDINRPVIQGGSLPISCLIKISVLCLNTGCCSKICCKAHLDELSESSQILPVSPFPCVNCGFISPPFFFLEQQNSGFL